jgi:type I restriction enzyme R subunit
MVANEAFARVKIDQLLRDADWQLTDGRSVRFEYSLDDGGKADYALFDRQGRALAVLEAKSTSVDLAAGEAQGRRYADQLDVPLIFLSNGEEVWFCDKEQDAHFRKVETVFSQDDLVRRRAARGIRRSPLDIPIDRRIAGGGGRLFQTACIDTLCREMVNGRRKMLVEMATGTGRTRTAAAPLKRLSEANWVTRALFVVDRNTLAIQAEDAFAELLPLCPAIGCRAPVAASRTRKGSPSSPCKHWSTSMTNTRRAISTWSSSTSATGAQRTARCGGR